jgi:hypothetical protein
MGIESRETHFIKMNFDIWPRYSVEYEFKDFLFDIMWDSWIKEYMEKPPRINYRF